MEIPSDDSTFKFMEKQRLIEDASPSKNYLLHICCVALLFRLLRAYFDTGVEDDALLYLKMAHSWAEAGTDAAYSHSNWIPPLLPWLLSCSIRAGLDTNTFGEVLGALLGSLLPFFVYHTGQRLGLCKQAIFFAAILVAVHPLLIRYSVDNIRDSLYIPLFCASLYFAVSAVKTQNYRWWIALGCTCGLALLTRREAPEILILPIIYAGIQHFTGNKQQWGKNIVAGYVIAVTVLCMVTTPAYMYLKETKCRWSPLDSTLQKIIADLRSGVKK